MKVAYLLGSLNRGGTETLVLDVFKNADKASYDFIGIHRKDGPYKDDFYATTPKFIQCAASKNIIGYFKRLRKILLDNEIQIAHAQQFIDAVFAHFATMGTGIKVVETFHGYDFGVKGLSRWLIKKSFDWCDAVYFVSNEEMRYYLGRYGHRYSKKCHVVYNGVNFEKILSPKTTKENTTLKLGTVGNFVAARQQSTLVKFLYLLHTQGVSFDFYFVGKRSDTEPCRYDDCVKYCEEHNLMNNVHFLGSRTDVPQLLNSWDAFLYSTSHDTFGIAVVEAIASGLPTFVNDWEVMKEITDNGKLAHLYKTNDPDDLLKVFNDYLANKSKYKTEALENAKLIRQKFNIEQHLSRLSEVYSTLYNK